MEFEPARLNCTVALSRYDPAKSESAGAIAIGDPLRPPRLPYHITHRKPEYFC